MLIGLGLDNGPYSVTVKLIGLGLDDEGLGLCVSTKVNLRLGLQLSVRLGFRFRLIV